MRLVHHSMYRACSNEKMPWISSWVLLCYETGVHRLNRHNDSNESVDPHLEDMLRALRDKPRPCKPRFWSCMSAMIREGAPVDLRTLFCPVPNRILLMTPRAGPSNAVQSVKTSRIPGTLT